MKGGALPKVSSFDKRAEKLSRMALYEQSERKSASAKAVTTLNQPVYLRIALAVAAGILLLLGQYSALWAWLGAAAMMASVIGAPAPVGAACGAIAAGLAFLRIFGASESAAVFFMVLAVTAAGGALCGAVAALISKRVSPYYFAFLAPLLPAGLEYLYSISSVGPLASTALTQYGSPAIVCIGRLGGLAGVTYVIFLFGAAVASAIRYVQSPAVAAATAGPAVGLCLVGLLYGAVSDCKGDGVVAARTFRPTGISAEREKLAAAGEYDKSAWEGYMKAVVEQAHRESQQSVNTRMRRAEEQQPCNLLVWPEASVIVNSEAQADFLLRVSGMARANRCVQALGFYDAEEMRSRAIILGADGETPELISSSRETFVSGVDDTFMKDQVASAGGDEPQVVETAYGKMGVICSLDGNSFGQFRKLARGGAQLVCVAGLDDEKVPATSMRLLVFNAALSGLSVVRTADNGTLALIDPNGAVIRAAGTKSGINVAVDGEVPLGTGSTTFLKVGNAFSWLALLGGLLAGLYAASQPTPPDEMKSAREEDGPVSFRSRDGKMRGL